MTIEIRTSGVAFGPLAASALTAAGHGMSRLCIRTRDVLDGAWHEAAAVRPWRDVADQVRRG